MDKTRTNSGVLVILQRDARVPPHRQIETSIRDSIRAGRLPRGSSLPPSRVLAADLGVSRGVVVEAYQQLAAEGYLASHAGGYTQVAAGPSRVTAGLRPSGPPPPRVDLSYGLADVSSFPRAAWLRAIRRALTEAPNGLFGYLPGRGVPQLRSAIADYLNRVRGTVAQPDHVVIGTGYAQAISLLIGVLAAGGARRLALEDPSSRDDALPTARAAGLEVVGYRTDVTGLTQDEARALFVLTTGGAQEDLGLGGAARSAILKVMRAVPEPFRPAAAATSQRILVDPARWMRSPDPVGQLGVLQAAVFAGRRLRLRYRSSGQRSPSERVVDPYGLVSKAGVWYLVADQDGEPRLFRVSRVASAVADEVPVRRRDGVELAELWGLLRQQVEERPTGVPVVVRVRRERLDMFRRICAANLAEDAGDGGDDGDAGWALVGLRFAAVPAARTLLSFGGDVEVVSPPEVRADLATVAAAVVARYA